LSQIEIQNLKKEFKDSGVTTEVLKGIDLSIDAGETLCIVGASGAGKSTLLHIVGTLDTPTSGRVLYEGDDLFQKDEKELCHFRNKSLGFIFQFHHLLPDFTALENVMMPLMIRGEKNKVTRQKASYVLERVGLSSKGSNKPSQLSGGEQQRVAIARALVGSPDVVLADEPTGNLDTRAGEQVFDLLFELNKELKTTLIVVTHNDELAKRMPKIIRLTDGIIDRS